MNAVRQRRAAPRRVPPAAMVLDELDRPRHPCLDGMVGGLEAQDEQGLLVGVDAVDASLVVVDGAQVGRIEPGLADGAHGPGGREEVGEAEHGAAAGSAAGPAAASTPR